MTVTITETREVQLSAEEALRVAREVIRERLHLPENPTIENRKLHTTFRDGGGAHSWISKEVVREASELDIAAVRILAALT